MDNIYNIILFIAIAILLRYLYKVARRRNIIKEEFYKGFAKKHQLEHKTELNIVSILNTVEGQIEGYSIKLWEFQMGRHNILLTNLSLANSSNDFQFRIGKRKYFEKFIPSDHIIEVKFDDPELDEFVFHSENEDLFRRLFDNRKLEKLKALNITLEGEIINSDGYLTYKYAGGFLSEEDVNYFRIYFDFLKEIH